MAHFDLTSLEEKICELEKLNYPEVSKLEHQLEILLGEKKIAGQSASQTIDEKSKDEYDSLYQHLSGLTCLTDLTGLVSKVYLSNDKFVEMGSWTEKIENSVDLHSDFLAELTEDGSLLGELEETFKSNIEAARQVLGRIQKINSK